MNSSFHNNTYHYPHDNLRGRKEEPRDEARQVAETRSRNSKRNGLKGREAVGEEGERTTTQLSAGPSRPTSCRKGKVRPTERTEVTIVCWAVSPHQSDVPRRQQQQLHEEDVIARRQSGKFCYFYKIGGKDGIWWSLCRTRSNPVSQYRDWSILRGWR